MSSAIKAVTSGSLGINRSALQYGVPKSTLKDRIAGRVKHGTKPGPVTYLQTKEEEELVNFLFECSKTGMERQNKKCYKLLKML